MPAAGAVRIETAKPFGPAPGRFVASGALAESGTFLSSSPIVADPKRPGTVTVHVCAYETLRGRGHVTGTADDTRDLITRTYEGVLGRA
jgi:hypothetical protein